MILSFREHYVVDDRQNSISDCELFAVAGWLVRAWADMLDHQWLWPGDGEGRPADHDGPHPAWPHRGVRGQVSRGHQGGGGGRHETCHGQGLQSTVASQMYVEIKD